MVLVLGVAQAVPQRGISKAVASPVSDRRLILAVLDRVVQAEAEKDLVGYRAEGWPDAKFSVRQDDEPLSKADSRAWQDPFFSVGPISHRVRLLRPKIVMHGQTAHVLVKADGWDLHVDDSGEFVPSGERFRETNDVILEKRGSRWRVLTWDRSVRRFASEAQSTERAF
jgi:hypothetical protein